MGQLKIGYVQQAAQDLEARANSRDENNKRGEFEWWSPQMGQNVFRWGVPWREVAEDAAGRVWLGRTAGGLGLTVHRWYNVPGVVGNNGEAKSLINYARTFPDLRLQDPIGDALRRIQDEFKIDVSKGTQAIRCSPKLCTNVLVRTSGGQSIDDEKQTWQLGTLPVSVFNWLISQINNPEIGDVTDPVAGFDITVQRVGERMETKYTPGMVPRPKPLHSSKARVKQLLAPRTTDNPIGIINIDAIFPEPTEAKINQQLEAVDAIYKHFRVPVRTTVGVVGKSRAASAPPVEVETQDSEDSSSEGG